MTHPDIPESVLAAYGFEHASLTPITIGLVNKTFRVDHPVHGRFVLQRLHPVFAPEVNLDLEAVTAHVHRRGLPTPRLVRTRQGEASVEDDGHWRALTWLEGTVFSEVASPQVAHHAGALAGRFHRATADLEHSFAFTRAGVHDTDRHLAKLESLVAEHATHPRRAELEPLAHAILAHAASLPALPSTRTRVVHGDLKITNLLFDSAGERGLAVLDLDTLAHGSLPVELGDALRSWCNPRGESDDAAHCDVDIFEAAVTGYLGECEGHLDADEVASIPLGLERIATELASRFAADAYEDRYFGWDPTRFASRVDHNRARAASQLALARSVSSRRGGLYSILTRLYR